MSSKMKKIKYLTCRMRSCSNCVIELNLKMWILTKCVTTFLLIQFNYTIKTLPNTTCPKFFYFPFLKIFKISFHNLDMKKNIFRHIFWYQKHRVGFCFNCVIELKICCKNWFAYVMMTTELFIKYFCSIKMCCL
jgi:hypothetical protein